MVTIIAILLIVAAAMVVWDDSRTWLAEEEQGENIETNDEREDYIIGEGGLKVVQPFPRWTAGVQAGSQASGQSRLSQRNCKSCRRRCNCQRIFRQRISIQCNIGSIYDTSGVDIEAT